MTEAPSKEPARETPKNGATHATVGYEQPVARPAAAPGPAASRAAPFGIGYDPAATSPPAPPVMRPVSATVGYATRAPLPRPAPPALRPVTATVGYATPAAPPAIASPLPAPIASPPPAPIDATLVDVGPAVGAMTIAATPPDPDALAATVIGEARATSSDPTRAAAATTTTQARATVFPTLRVGDTGTVIEPPGALQRYERMRALGEGGVGEVALARDHDIDRVVAVKRLRADQISPAAIGRFAEEVRTVGRLEHPNIVPIHDVGIDEEGQHYFVMKYVEGETLESIIEHLAAGDEAYRARFSYEHRAQLFLGILQAVGYAHAQGIIHRDIKPANVMVGSFGEVMVMDWGIAKKVRGASATPEPASGDEPAPDPNEGGRDRLFKTRNGALLGTPAYMSPEQARGANDQLDERSDVYSLTVLFHELMTGRHYLHDKETIGAMLVSVMDVDRSVLSYIADASRSGCPMEWLHFIRKGMSQDPAARYASIAEMITGVQAILDGECKVQCHVTLIKRTNNEVMHSVDAHPFAMAFAVFATAGLSLAGAVALVRAVMHAVGG